MSAAPFEPDDELIPLERLRPRSLGLKPLRRGEIESRRVVDADTDVAALRAERPRTRGDCRGGPRPCPWVSCSMHLALDPTPEGAAKINFPDGHGGVAFESMAETCALDVADRGERLTLEEVADLFNLTLEGLRQIERRALRLARVELAVPASKQLTGRPPLRPRRSTRRRPVVLTARAVALRRNREILEANRAAIRAWLVEKGTGRRSLAGLRWELSSSDLLSGAILRFVRREFPEMWPAAGLHQRTQEGTNP